MEWKEFWSSLLDKQKLRQKVLEMDEVDRAKNHSVFTEEICHSISNDYENLKQDLKVVEREIWNILGQFQGVHLHTSRIKSMDSLIEKVINKRHEWLADDKNKYAQINGDNYRDIISDLIGLRLIINYRGHWPDLHEKILEEFPFDKNSIYEKDKLLPHSLVGSIQAELPKAYYAEGDDIRQYVEKGLIPKKHKMNYRSIHYTVSFHNVYIEIQVRTIYDEAWSDCDHSYVYKKDDNKSHTALEQMSGILAKLTNLSNDIGEQMKDIYDTESIVEDKNGGWKASEEISGAIDKSIDRMEVVWRELKRFREKLSVDKRVEGGVVNNE